jgi:hypothetical protein
MGCTRRQGMPLDTRRRSSPPRTGRTHPPSSSLRSWTHNMSRSCSGCTRHAHRTALGCCRPWGTSPCTTTRRSTVGTYRMRSQPRTQPSRRSCTCTHRSASRRPRVRCTGSAHCRRWGTVSRTPRPRIQSGTCRGRSLPRRRCRCRAQCKPGCCSPPWGTAACTQGQRTSVRTRTLPCPSNRLRAHCMSSCYRSTPLVPREGTIRCSPRVHSPHRTHTGPCPAGPRYTDRAHCTPAAAPRGCRPAPL